MKSITKPVDFYGFEPGSDRNMIHWNDIVKYFYLLNEQSGKIIVENMGKSTEGYDYLCAYISSEENLKNLEHYKEVSRKLTDPRGLSQDEIDALVKEGRAFCLVQMSMHSNEVGGTQCVSTLAYELITKDDEQTKKILDNTILVLIPCGCPDGEIDFYEWYNKTKGTPDEGRCSPSLRHKYAGHSNNRDGVHMNLVESKYVYSLINECAPVAFMDHHHQAPEMDRLTITPFVDPINPEMSPLLLREFDWVGGSIAADLSRHGVKGVVTYDEFYQYWLMYSLIDIVRFRNIIGILAESADAHIATPAFIHPETLKENKCAHVIPSTKCPEPWEGGWWHLSDICRQIILATTALLKHLAHNKEEMLSNMAFKALAQTKRGENDEVKAFIIPRAQHDPSVLNTLLHVFKWQKIDVFNLDEDFGTFKKGDLVVPTNQPNYALLKIILTKTDYPVNEFSTRRDGSVISFDMTTANITEQMGIRVFECGEILETSELTPVVLSSDMPANENESYKKANALLNRGEKVWRDEKGNFNTNGVGREVYIPKVALLKMRENGNCEEGFTRLLLETFDFPYELAFDDFIRDKAILDDFDVLIIPGDTEMIVNWGFRSSGEPILQRFLNRGGRIIAWGESCEVVSQHIRRNIINETKGVPKARFNASGSALRVKLSQNDITLGCEKETIALYQNEGVFKIVGDVREKVNYEIFARYADKNLLTSGLLVGEEYINGKPCGFIVKGRNGGDAVLFGFDPKFRMQTDATYKLLFNAIYRYK